MTPTDRTYEKICKKRKVQPRSVVLEDGTRAHWIGREVPETVIVNFHGECSFLSSPGLWVWDGVLGGNGLLGFLEEGFLERDVSPARIRDVKSFLRLIASHQPHRRDFFTSD